MTGPTRWPEYVSDYEPEICSEEHIGKFNPEFFERNPSEVIEI